MSTRRGIGENLPSVPDLLLTRLISGVAELTEPIAIGSADPPGGVGAALAVSLAATLAAAAAERSRTTWEEAGAVRAQAQTLRRRSLELAQRDAAAHAEARQRLGDRTGQSGDWQLGQAVSAAAQPLLDLAACARDLAQLAELLAGHAEGDVRPDAVVAAMLAAGGARAAGHLVEINLVVGADDATLAGVQDRVFEAETAASAAGAIR